MDIATLLVGVVVAYGSAASGSDVEPVDSNAVRSIVQEHVLGGFFSEVQSAQWVGESLALWRASVNSVVPLGSAVGQSRGDVPQVSGLILDRVYADPEAESVVRGFQASGEDPEIGSELNTPEVGSDPSSVIDGSSPAATASSDGLSVVSDAALDPNLSRDTISARAIVEAARGAIGLPYQWGGGLLTGPSMGDGSGGAVSGFDCSGLSRFAYYVGTGGKMVLPRTSQEQFRAGEQIPMSEAQPGDLLFGNWQSDGANHVAIFLGEGTMIEAPQTGELVQISDIRSDMIAVRFL